MSKKYIWVGPTGYNPNVNKYVEYGQEIEGLGSNDAEILVFNKLIKEKKNTTKGDK